MYILHRTSYLDVFPDNVLVGLERAAEGADGLLVVGEEEGHPALHVKHVLALVRLPQDLRRGDAVRGAVQDAA